MPRTSEERPRRRRVDEVEDTSRRTERKVGVQLQNGRLILLRNVKLLRVQYGIFG